MHSCQRPDPGSEYLIQKFSLRTDIKCLMFVLRLSTVERSELENLDKELKALNKKFKSLSSKLNIKNKQIQDAGWKIKKNKFFILSNGLSLYQKLKSANPRIFATRIFQTLTL